jgi:general secretion pathway protein A
LVEVGWEGDLEAELVRAEDSGKEWDDPGARVADPNEELVEDRYAALQAWAEWTRNRERSLQAGSAAAMPAPPVEPMKDPETTPGAGPITAAESSSASPAASIRSESPHDFAPYSQLFTRLRQSNQG